MIFAIRLLFVSRRWFSHERFSRIELLQNKCFQKYVSSTFESLIVSTIVLFFVWNSVNFLALKSKNQIYWSFLCLQFVRFHEFRTHCSLSIIICIAIHFVASAHSLRRRRSYFCFRVRTFIEKTNYVIVLFEFTITYSFKRFVRDLLCRRISETKNKTMYSTVWFIVVSFLYFVSCEVCCVRHSYNLYRL